MTVASDRVMKFLIAVALVVAMTVGVLIAMVALFTNIFVKRHRRD
jgi:hypothetical protein